MENLRLSDHVFAAAILADLVLFDSAADRYLALPGSLVSGSCGVDIGMCGTALAVDAATALLAAGLAIPAKGSAPTN